MTPASSRSSGPSQWGTSGAGKPLPLLVLSDPPVNTPEDATGAKKPVVMVTANIHAGEVDGKEAVLMLARDLLAEKDNPILKKLVVVVAPNFNPDGNDKLGEWRKSQNGPKEVGTRANAGGYDLNRDFVKLETPETRGVVGLLNKWNPLLVIDCHTTNGSYHRYTLTYDGPRLPAADPRLIDFARDKLLPAVNGKVKTATGFDSFTYGDFDRPHEQWVTYGSGPRYGTQLYSLRGSVGVLSESYTYSSFEDRVKVSYAFVKGNFEYVAENLEAVKKVVADAQKTRAKVAVRSKTVARDKPETVFGWVEEVKDGRTVRTDKPKDYTCRILDKLEAAEEVEVPAAYLIPAEYADAANTLRRHGIQVDEVREQIVLDTETYTVTAAKEEREFQKHKLRTVEAKAAKSTTRVEPGTFLVRTSQPLGQLAAFLLEPAAEDGLTTWNFFDKGVAVGKPFPVLRVKSDQPVFTGSPRPLPEEQVRNKAFGLEQLGRGVNVGGQPLGDITWLDDGEHWLQQKDGKLWKVHARSGKAELFVDPDKLKKSMAAVDGVEADDPPTGGGRAGGRRASGGPGANYTFNPDRSGVVMTTKSGAVLAYRDGKPGVRLTKIEKDKPAPEAGSFSPDGKRYAYVLNGNLFALELATGKVAQLTTDGGANDVLNGRGDWVYEEEIFNRNPKAYWWSPDSTRIAFLRFDDKSVPKFYLTETVAAPRANTADSMLNAFHVVFEESVFRLEQANARKLPLILADIDRHLPAAEKALAGDAELSKTAGLRARVFLGTARALLDPKALPTDADARTLVEAEVKRVTGATRKEKPAWLGKPDDGFVALDYTRFEPRGFYTRTPKLAAYFRALSWLQAVPWRAEKDDEFAAVLLLAHAYKAAKGQKDWVGEGFWDTFNKFLGNRDDWDIRNATGYVPETLTAARLAEERSASPGTSRRR